MTPYTRNDQDYLAEKFLMLETHLVEASRIAFLKIQSWKFAMKTPEVGEGYQREAEAMLMKSFLHYVPNNFILSEEGYYFSGIEN